MKKVMNFFKKHSWIWVLIACLVFIPQSFTYQAKLNMRVLVTGIAIDKSGEEYEITAQVIMPTPGSEAGGMGARLDFISEKGDSVAEGLQKIAYKIGKTAGLSHTNFVLVGESMLEENLASALDYFARNAKVTPSVMLLVCAGSAKDMIQQTQNLELSVGVGLQKVFIFKQSSLNGLIMPLDEFINRSFTLAKSAFISGILIAPEGEETLGETTDATNKLTTGGAGEGSSGNQTSQSQSQESSGSEDGSSSSSGTSGQQSSKSSTGQSDEKKARIKFYNDVYYFKNGVYVNKLDKEEEILGVFWADVISNNGDFKVSNVNGGLLEDATIGIHFTRKTTKTSVKFKNGNPVLVFDISIRDAQIVEILNHDKPNVNIYNKHDEEMIELVKRSIEEEVEKCILAAFNKAKNDNVDIFDIGERAYQTKTKEWKKYYSENGDNYLKNCDVEVNVKIKNIN